MLTLILPIHIEIPADEAAVTRMLDSLEADSLSLCQCERLVLLSGTYSRELRGRLHKMASRFVEDLPQSGARVSGWLALITQNECLASNCIVLDSPCVVMKGWLDRLVIAQDKLGGKVRQGNATYYPRRQIST